MKSESSKVAAGYDAPVSNMATAIFSSATVPTIKVLQKSSSLKGSSLKNDTEIVSISFIATMSMPKRNRERINALVSPFFV
eukprot:48624-Ditylum_brightwellii.AAC.2